MHLDRNAAPSSLLKSLLLCAMIFISACSKTDVTDVWSKANTEKRSIDRLLVVGIDPSAISRRNYEDGFVRELQELGVNGLASYEVLGKQTQATRKALQPSIRDKNIDAILLSSIVAIDEEEYLVGSGYRYRYGYGDLHGWYDSYYPWAYDTVYNPGYFVDYKEYYLQTSLYDARSGELLWSAKSQTVAPGSISELVDSVPPEVADALADSGLLARNQRAARR